MPLSQVFLLSLTFPACIKHKPLIFDVRGLLQKRLSIRKFPQPNPEITSNFKKLLSSHRSHCTVFTDRVLPITCIMPLKHQPTIIEIYYKLTRSGATEPPQCGPITHRELQEQPRKYQRFLLFKGCF